MQGRVWPLSRQFHSGIRRLRLPEYTSAQSVEPSSLSGSTTGVLHHEDHWEALAGEGHRVSLLTALLPANRHWLIVSDRAAGQRAKGQATAWVEKIAASDSSIRVQLTWWGDRSFVLVPPGNEGMKSQILWNMSADDEHQPNFVFVRPQNTETWAVQDLVKWCKSKPFWSQPEIVVPKCTQLLLAGFDGDLYCAEPQVENRCLDAATRWAATYAVSVTLREGNAWFPA